MTQSNFKDHFSSQSADYAVYRPTYPMQLVDELVKLSPSQQTAWDCGCGTGQLSVLLAERFQKVIATDASAAQIEKAQAKENITYRVALAENSGLPEASVDLITVAQAAHWFDLDKFYSEVRRVARPKAAIALITYGIMHVEGNVDSIVQHFYSETIGSYWPPERRLVEEGYRSLPFPFKETKIPDLAIEVSWKLSDLIGYFSTWSAVKAAQKVLGTNPVEIVEAELRAKWGDPEVRRKVHFPLPLRVGNVSS